MRRVYSLAHQVAYGHAPSRCDAAQSLDIEPVCSDAYGGHSC
jgi:hypothetical protein